MDEIIIRFIYIHCRPPKAGPQKTSVYWVGYSGICGEKHHRRGMHQQSWKKISVHLLNKPVVLSFGISFVGGLVVAGVGGSVVT